MARKPKSGKLTGTTVTLVRTRPKAIQASDTFRKAVLGSEFAKGGSANLYAFDPPLAAPTVAKIYSDKYRADPSLNPVTKLVALVVRHDELAARLPFVMWPSELILDREISDAGDVGKALLGFTMASLPHDTMALFSFLKQEKYRNKFPIAEHVRLAARIAEQMARLHAAGLVFCDLNPKNIHVSRDLARVYFLDADGYQASLKGTPVPSRGVTEGYASPGAIAHHATHPNALLTPGDDDFVLAILIFQLLVDRAHPFATGPLYTAHPDATLNESIAARRFAYSNPALYHPMGDTQAIYARLATPLKAAFLRSFLTSHPLPAVEWTRLLLQHAAAPLNGHATPEPNEVDWKAPPKRTPPSPGGSPAPPRRTPSRRLPPVLPHTKKSTAAIVGLVALPAAVGAGAYWASTHPSAPVEAPAHAWETHVHKPLTAEAKGEVAQILAELPQSIDALQEILQSRRQKPSK